VVFLDPRTASDKQMLHGRRRPSSSGRLASRRAGPWWGRGDRSSDDGSPPARGCLITSVTDPAGPQLVRGQQTIDRDLWRWELRHLGFHALDGREPVRPSSGRLQRAESLKGLECGGFVSDVLERSCCALNLCERYFSALDAGSARATAAPRARTHPARRAKYSEPSVVAPHRHGASTTERVLRPRCRL